MKKKLSKILKNINFWLIVWSRSLRHQNTRQFVVSMLVVKNPEYVNFAKDCIKSFLNFHPNSKFEIHVDAETIGRTKEIFHKYLDSGKVQLIETLGVEKNWQELKLEIILNQSGTHNIFMDADLRWYGPLPPILNLTFYTDEGLLIKSAPFFKIFESHPHLNKESHMLNVSFVAFAGISIPDNLIEKIKHVCSNYDEILSKSRLTKNDFIMIERLREQFALSVYASEISAKVRTLKPSDNRAERNNLVSSCYFGSTGLGF
jgi:hypothetical protein